MGRAGDRVLEKKKDLMGFGAWDLTEEIAAITTEIEKDEPVREHCAIEDRICFQEEMRGCIRTYPTNEYSSRSTLTRSF